MAFHLNQTPARRASRRRTTRDPITPHEAKQRAYFLLAEGKITGKQSQVLSTLAVAGVLDEQQLARLIGISGRSLRRYHSQHLLDRLYVVPASLRTVGFIRAGESLRLYKLGAVGRAIVAHDQPLVPSGYEGFGVHRLTHDVLANEVMIRVARAGADAGYDPIWLSKYEATVHDDAGRPMLEPDAMLELRHAHRATQRFLLEYHNEDDSRRAAGKIKRYEEVARDGHWQHAWNTETLPTVLVSWTHNAVATGYSAAIERQAHRHLGLRFRYLGMPIQRLLAGGDPLQWKEFLSKEVAPLLPEVFASTGV